MTVFTHRHPDDTAATLELLARRAHEAGVRLRLDREESAKHDLGGAPGVELCAENKRDVELCVVLGGDGTILRALQSYAGTEVPVFAINFGEIGCLATVERQDAEAGIARALGGDFELLHLPGIVVELDGEPRTAINDVAVHR
jgi:NAD+ kinase